MNGNSSIIRAIRGPVMLMALGGVMAVDHFGPYPFWKTWPVLLILLGVFELMKRLITTAPVEGR